MSHIATGWAYQQTGLTIPQKFVLVALADFADEDGSCYPGQERLASMTGCSERSIRRYLVALEELHLIERGHRYGPDGKRTSDLYRLRLADNLSASKNDSTSGQNPLTSGQPGSLLADTVVHRTPVEPLVRTPDRARKRATRIPDGFQPTTELRGWAVEKGMPVAFIEAETESFIDYWRAAPGQRGVKADWVATWRNWMRKAWSDPKVQERHRRAARSSMPEAWR